MTPTPYLMLYPEQVDASGGAPRVRMCDLRVFPNAVVFLSHYYNYIQSSDDMLMIDKTVRRCWEFQVCPKQILRIENRDLQRRKVQVAVREGTNIKKRSALRDHCPRDVERCWGMGYLFGDSCSARHPKRG